MGSLDLLVFLFAATLVAGALFGPIEIGGTLFRAKFGSEKYLWERVSAGSLGALLLALESRVLLARAFDGEGCLAALVPLAISAPILFYCLALWLHDWDRTKRRSSVMSCAFLLILGGLVVSAIAIGLLALLGALTPCSSL